MYSFMSRQRGMGRATARAAAMLSLAAFAAGALHQCTSAPPTVSGTIVAEETHAASRVGGRVARVAVAEGSSVIAGQVLVELDAPELEARRAAVAAALEELRAGSRPQEVTAAKSDADAISADLETARSDLKRARDLFKQNAIPASERDRAASRVTALEKGLAAARARRDLLTSGPREQTIAQAEARLAEADAQVAETVLRSPGAFVVETVNVKAGEVALPGQRLVTLVDPAALSVCVYVPETWLGHIRDGEEVRLRVDSFSGRDFRGTVEKVARSAEFTPRNVQTAGDRIRQVFGVTLRLAPGQEGLRAGMAADALFAGVQPEAK
jgi:HlyD family secretion protein